MFSETSEKNFCADIRALKDWIWTKQSNKHDSVCFRVLYFSVTNINYNNNNSLCVGLTKEGSVSSRNTHCYGYDFFAILDYKLNSC